MDVLALQLFREREFVFDKYVQQGYLGRFLLYLIDKIVQASVTSFAFPRPWMPCQIHLYLQSASQSLERQVWVQ